MRLFISAVFALVIAISTVACSDSRAGASQSSSVQTEKICGTVSALKQINGLDQIWVITFSDGRSLWTQNIPEITITKDKMYSFEIVRSTSEFKKLVKTIAADTCGYDTSSPVSTDTVTIDGVLFYKGGNAAPVPTGDTAK